MKHIDEFKVYYADTDAYGVVWHGSYLRWMEVGRIEYTTDVMGLNLKDLQENGIVLPVVELNIKYKRSAKAYDNIVLETEVDEIKKSFIKFKQVLKNKESDSVYIIAEVTCVAVDSATGKMIRQMPDYITNACLKN